MEFPWKIKTIALVSQQHSSSSSRRFENVVFYFDHCIRKEFLPIFKMLASSSSRQMSAGYVSPKSLRCIFAKMFRNLPTGNGNVIALLHNNTIIQFLLWNSIQRNSPNRDSILVFVTRRSESFVGTYTNRMMCHLR